MQSGSFALFGGFAVIPEAPLCAARPVVESTTRKPITEVTSVGITYFAGRSRNGDDAHLAAALTSELAHQLLSARVATRAPARGRANERLLSVKLSDGGDLTDVDLSMTGSVFREDGMLRTAVRVTRTSDGAVIWTGTKIRPILDLPILARLIAQEVVTRVGAKLSTPAPRAAPEKTAELYELVLRGLHARSRYDADELSRAIGYFEQAVEMDLKSIQARELRESAELRLLAWGGRGDTLERRLLARNQLRRVLQRARDASERLVEEADEEIRDGQLTHACQLVKEAIALDAHSTPAYALRSLLRVRGGQVREAFSDAETVTQLGRPVWGNALRAIVLTRAGDTARAGQETRRLVVESRKRRGTLPFWDARFIAMALNDRGDWPGAQATLRRIDPKDPRVPWLRADPGLQPPTAPQRPTRRSR
ncbi:MAG: hypothetical protein ABIP93_09385 [Gemmatimonadaceae bacterium]